MIRLRRRVRPAEAPPTDIYVVDGTDTDVGAALCERIGPSARPVVPETLDARTACVVIALPAHARVPPVATRRVIAVLGGFADGPARLRVPVVISWCASHAARLRLSADASFNPTPLLVGAAWRNELRYHADTRIAATCRSRRVRELVRGTAKLGGIRSAELLATIDEIDPDCVHTLLVEVGEPDERGWTDLAALIAAVELRVGSG